MRCRQSSGVSQAARVPLAGDSEVLRKHPGRLDIEFFGLPGSGKTTIAKRLISQLSASTVPILFGPTLVRDDAAAMRRVLTKLKLIGGEIGLGGSAPRAVVRALAVPQASFLDRAKAGFNLASVISLCRFLERSGQSSVLDQGVLQAIWSIGLRATDGFAIERWEDVVAEAANEIRIHVSVECPTALCMQRLDSRSAKHSRMQAGELSGSPLAWKRAELLRQEILAEVQSAYGRRGLRPRLLVVDGTSGPEEAAKSILTRLGDFDAIGAGSRPRWRSPVTAASQAS